MGANRLHILRQINHDVGNVLGLKHDHALDPNLRAESAMVDDLAGNTEALANPQLRQSANDGHHTIGSLERVGNLLLAVRPELHGGISRFAASEEHSVDRAGDIDGDVLGRHGGFRTVRSLGNQFGRRIEKFSFYAGTFSTSPQ